MVKEVHRDKWGMTSWDAVSDQLARFGITAYVELHSEDEGRILPSGAEEGSGVGDVSMTFLASDGNGYDVLLRWNPDKTAPDGSKGYYELESPMYGVDKQTGKKTLKWVPWIEGQPIPREPIPREEPKKQYIRQHLKSYARYFQARKVLGLPVSEDQEEALRDYLAANPDPNDRVRGVEKVSTVLHQPPTEPSNQT